MEEQEHRFQLEKYHQGSKGICPQCGKKGFVYYIDIKTGERIDKFVGRCDHESSCGYHLSPRQFFLMNPDKRPDDKSEPVRPLVIREAKKKVCLFPNAEATIEESLKNDCTFKRFLRSLLLDDDFKRVCQMYQLGGWIWKDNIDRVVYWQRDIKGRVRTGKVMAYNKDGHRIKNILPNWMHTIVSKPDEWKVSQCLYGEHLLSEYPDKVVAVVEAEKTAIIGSAIFPDYVWLSTGGKSSKVADKMKVLSGRKVIVFPDVDAFDSWSEIAHQITWCKKIVVSDTLETHASEEERSRKIDIADWMIEELMSKPHQENR